MMILDKLAAALGPPQFLCEIRSGCRRPVAAVGRWRHRGAFVDLGGIDTMQVIFNLSGGQVVDLRWRDRAVRNAIRAGTVAIVCPGHLESVTVSGEADTVQIVITGELIEAVTGEPAPAAPPQLGSDELLLQAAAVQALVAIAHDRRENELDRIVRGIAGLVGRRSTASRRARGGLAPAAKQRVRALIDERLEGDPCSPPTLGELADAAKLSVHYFIRAYRETEGQTPYARMARRRIDASLALLLRDDARVDEVAETMGFSSPSHFVSTFRRHMGVTPGALRDAARA
jgi:AraC family transcriptional regulator